MARVLTDSQAARVGRVVVEAESRAPNLSRSRKISVQPACFFPCNVRLVGGSAGDQNSDCTFTYDVYTIGGDKRLLEAVEPLKPRPHGRLEAQALEEPLDQIGVLFIDREGELQLWDAGEVPARRPCTPGGQNGG